MTSRSVCAAITTVLLAVPASVTAQTASTEVTIKIPVNLTSFGPDVAKVKVWCNLNSDAITNGTGTGNHYLQQVQEIPVSGGQVTTTASLVFSLTQLDNPVGKTANLNCAIQGWSTTEQVWRGFMATSPNPSFKSLSGDAFGTITSSFTW
jgi:hypothetical protein